LFQLPANFQTGKKRTGKSGMVTYGAYKQHSIFYKPKVKNCPYLPLRSQIIPFTKAFQK